MNLAENVRLAWEALVANRLRSALTLVGIVIGVAAVIFVVAIGRGTRAAVLSEFSVLSSDTFVVASIPPSEGTVSRREVLFTDEDLRRLKAAIPEIREIYISVEWRTQLRAGSQSRWDTVQGSPAGITRVFKAQLADGRFYTEREEAAAARVVVLGSRVARDLFGDRRAVGQVIYAGGYPFQVVGVFQETTALARMMGNDLDRSIMAPLATVRRLTGVKEFQAITVEVRPGARVQDVMQETVDLLRRMHPAANYFHFSFQQVTAVVGRVGNILTAVIGAIAGVSLVVGGVGIMNIMLVSVTERTREIGIRKAIGARRVDILQQFLVEAVVICVTGGLIGTALAALPVWLTGRALGIPLLVSWDSVALALGFSALVGIVFGVYPANRAASLDPVEALRYE